MTSTENRSKIKNQFIKKHVNCDFSLEILPNDASFRVYERIITPEKTFMLMDSSLDGESIQPFIKVGSFLLEHDYSAPKIIAYDQQNGLVLLEDLGKDTYTNRLRNNSDFATEYEMYKNAVDVLINLHQLDNDVDLKVFNNEILLDEALLLVDYYLKILHGHALSQTLRNEYIEAWNKVLNCISYRDSCVVLRDYHVDNLIWMEDRVGMKRVGLLDFQDAVIGSYAYDIVSLLEDARRDVPEDVVSKINSYYLNNMPEIDNKKFLSDYVIFGVQRSCKIIGIFARKVLRDNDSRYLQHLPRTWSYVKKHINNPLLEPLKQWFSKIDIPIMRDDANL